jgi:hypothetical protein
MLQPLQVIVQLHQATVRHLQVIAQLHQATARPLQVIVLLLRVIVQLRGREVQFTARIPQATNLILAQEVPFIRLELCRFLTIANRAFL